jgi:DNA polymerase-3 subunit delta'
MDIVIGHNQVKDELIKAINNNMVSHAYIFEGIEGIGKFLLAKEFAKILLCRNNNTESCGSCESCLLIDNHPDFKIIQSEKSSIKVDQIRDLGLYVALKPIISQRKVYIINNAEEMTEEAQNALLKVLEEPPVYVTIIMVTSNKEKLLKTIKSRCVILKFNGLSKEELSKYYNGERIDDEVFKYSRGSISKMNKIKGENFFEVAGKIKEAIDSKDLLLMNKQINLVIKNKNLKENITEILDYLIFLYFNNIGSDYIKNTRIIEIIESSKQDLNRNANTEIALNAMTLWLLEVS